MRPLGRHDRARATCLGFRISGCMLLHGCGGGTGILTSISQVIGRVRGSSGLAMARFQIANCTSPRNGCDHGVGLSRGHTLTFINCLRGRKKISRSLLAIS